MNTHVTIPRQALAELLAASGSTLTPEQYLASLPASDALKKYPSRARAAAWSKPVLALIAVLSVIFTVFFPDVENIIITIGLIAVTFFEYRVHRYFLEGDPRAPSLGFRNQACFSAGILVYCLYHAFAPLQISPETMSLIEQNNVIDPNALQSLTRFFYLFIALTAGGSQFALAWYYRSAQA
jgi:hypothetical protein